MLLVDVVYAPDNPNLGYNMNKWTVEASLWVLGNGSVELLLSVV